MKITIKIMIENLSEREYERLLSFTQSGHFKHQLQLEFSGILKNLNIKRHDFEFIEFLISENVYVECEELDEVFTDGELKNFVNNSDYRFGSEGEHKGKYYGLNFKIYEEIFNHVELFVISRFSNYYAIDKNLITAELCSFLTADEKIKFLIEKQSMLWTFFKGEDITEFLLFMEIPVAKRINKYEDEEDDEENDEKPIFENWQDYLIVTLTAENDFMELYLTNCKIKDNFESFFYETFKKWVNFYRIKELICFCRNSIDKIRTSNLGQIKNLKEIEIFKEDGLAIFNFIRENQVGFKNNAFYSYLYFFMKNEIKKLNVTSNDSISYRNFILNNEYLKSFSKIIKSEDYSPTKISAELEFKTILLTYSPKN